MPIIGFGGGFGGGGGGASYINGVVPTSADLPITVGNPAMDSVYLAKVGSGVWLINRKPAGLYCRTANNGVAADWTYLGAFPEVNADGNWELYNTADPTKELKFSLSGISTGTTRTLTVPNASGRIQVEGQPIGNVTPAAGTFTNLSAAPTSGSALTLTGGTVTASAPLIDATQTWNDAAVAFRALRVNVTNTASTSASLLADFQVGGSNVFSINRAGALGAGGTGWLAFNSSFGSAAAMSGVWSIGGAVFNIQSSLGVNYGVIQLGSNMSMGWSSNTAPTAASADLRLFRDAADTLAQYRGTNAQTFRIYNTFTDASNYERGFLRWSSNILQIGSEKAGTGTRRTLEFVTDGTARWRVGDGSISAAPSMLALGNTAIFGTNESYNVIIATGAQGTVNAGVFSPNNSNTGYLAIGESLHLGLTSSGTSGDVRLVRDAANVLALRNSTTAQAYRIYNTVSGTSNVNFERASFRWASSEFIIDAEAGGTGTLRGIKLGSATSSLLGFYGATPAAQQSSTGTNATGFTAHGPHDTVHANSTFTGNVGTTAYSISDIVKHLKTIGLIAS